MISYMVLFLLRWTHMNKHGFSQLYREGWLMKYGFDPDKRS